jgi:NIMA (never in mitosis gene a)-related kinase
LINKEDHVKLTNFGVNLLLESTSQQASTFVCDRSYLTPEIHNVQPYLISEDIWSLGCILYHLMTLKYPFAASKTATLINLIKNGNYDPLT